MSTNALLVIDMQYDLCEDERRREKASAMMTPLLELIDAFDERGQLIIYAYFALSEDDAQFKRFGDRYCIEGTRGAEIIHELMPLRGPLLRKTKHSAFFDTPLDAMLRDAGVENLYLAGMQTQICIMTTAADASFRGYRAVAVDECVISTRDEKKRMALDWIAEYAGDVRTVGQTIAEIS